MLQSITFIGAGRVVARGRTKLHGGRPTAPPRGCFSPSLSSARPRGPSQ